MTAVPDDHESVQFETRWDDGIGIPTSFVNELLLKVSPAPSGSPESVLLVFGRVESPNLAGTPEEQLAQARDIAVLPVDVVSKIAISPERVRLFARALTDMADRLEGTQG